MIIKCHNIAAICDVYDYDECSAVVPQVATISILKLIVAYKFNPW